MTSPSREYISAERIIGSISVQQIDLVKTKKDHQSYELFIFSLIARELNRDPNITNFQLENLINNVFRSKLSPGNMNRIDYSYASFEYMNQRFEIHLDTLFKQKSRTYHELDIAIIPDASFSADFICCAIKCKNYVTLPFSFGREFIGLLDDFYKTHTKHANFLRSDFLVTSGSPSPNGFTKFQSYFTARTKSIKINSKNRSYRTTYLFDNTNASTYGNFVNKFISDFKIHMN